ncbi:MAG: cohesin domain-containing protein [Desulfuromonadaceae bacterium]|nr:cohesin domain-containing protein [Desulfuromonadaceae bacterium]
MYSHPRRLIFASMLLVLSWSTSLFAAAIIITPSGDTSFSVQGSAMDGVAGIQLDISYDSASLATPSVTQGGLISGAMFAANTSLPGMIKIAIIRTSAFSGSGQIAAISFTNRQGTGGVTSANVTLINSSGTTVPGSVSITGGTVNSTSDQSSTPAVSQAQSTQTSQTTQTNQTTTNQTSSTIPTVIAPGTVTLPADMQQRAEQHPTPAATTIPASTPDAAPAPVQDNEPENQPSAKPIMDEKPVETPQYIVYKGILDRFKLYKGEKSLSAMAALFDKKIVQNIQQEPNLLISNGHDKAVLTIDIPASIGTSPNFAVNGGTLISFKQDKNLKGRWMVEILPTADALKVAVTIVVGSDEFEYPLTVTPPLKTALALDERGWEKFLKETGTPEVPLHDFNNDGIRDYTDEYMFVANFIIRKSTATKAADPAPAVTPPKPDK